MVYTVLYTLLSWAQGQRKVLPLVLTLLYAVSDEFHQSFTPNRVVSLMDLGLDASGALIAYFFEQKRLSEGYNTD